jgi:hypothetical protein
VLAVTVATTKAPPPIGQGRTAVVPVVAVDTTGRHAPLFLSRLARAIPEPEEEKKYGLYGAEWAAFGPAPSARTAISVR